MSQTLSVNNCSTIGRTKQAQTSTNHASTTLDSQTASHQLGPSGARVTQLKAILHLSSTAPNQHEPVLTADIMDVLGPKTQSGSWDLQLQQTLAAQGISFWMNIQILESPPHHQFSHLCCPGSTHVGTRNCRNLCRWISMDLNMIWMDLNGFDRWKIRRDTLAGPTL